MSSSSEPTEPVPEESAPEESAPEDQASANQQVLDVAVHDLWAKFQGQLMGQVETLEEALIALMEDQLDDDLRARAERDAHRLTGSAGTFGRHRASVLARQLENLFAGDARIGGASIEQAFTHVEELRQQLTTAPSPTLDREPDVPLLLVVHENPELGAAIGLAAEAKGMGWRVTESALAAEALIGDLRPAAALVEIGPHCDGAIELVTNMSAANPPTIVLAMTDISGLAGRIEAVNAGVRGFLPSSLTPSELVAAVLEGIQGERHDAQQVLAVDDDPAILAALSAMLEPLGYSVVGAGGPNHFWAALDENPPELVLLDLDMPEVSGIELCRLLRAEPRWRTLPVVFLTSHVDQGAIEAAFAAGADDYVSKPIVGPELVTRVINRLERTKTLLSASETDPLTGLANRRKVEAEWSRLQAMADRYGQPLSFALLDLDGLRELNDTYGHDVGDTMLQRVAQQLVRSSRGDDLPARWGGAEFALLLYAVDRADSVRRVAEVLEELSNRPLVAPGGQPFSLTFSAGVSEFGVDGSSPRELYRQAANAMFEAKGLGGNRVVPTGSPTPAADPFHAEIVVVEDDDVVAELLEYGLQARGYTTLRLVDGQAAVDQLTGPSRRVGRLVLLDISLPALDGFAVLEHLRRDGVLEQTRVIVLTARSSEDEVLRALELGAFDHVAKPFSLPILLQRVRVALSS